MLSVGVVVVAALLWLGVLFAAALYGERHPHAFADRWRHVYALSLAVHCTSWTFYGTITQAARHGWPLPPTFLGAILFYALAFAVMVRLVRLARESNATSLADLIATRLGKDAWLAATVTLVAALGLIPYIALQLKAVTMSFGTLTGSAVADVAQVPPWGDSALYVALAMALFTMLFGTRRVSAAEVARRIAHMRAGTPYVTERRFPGGAIIEIRGNPMPGGGFVATFTDVTAFRSTEEALRQVNETLEQRVAERTASLDQARREAEKANDAKRPVPHRGGTRPVAATARRAAVHRFAGPAA